MKKFILVFLSLFCFAEFAAAANWCKTTAQLNCMKNVINGEARGEGYNGMLMVGKTVATRMARGYSRTSSVCNLVSGAGFATRSSYPTSGQVNKTANANILKAAKKACTLGDSGVTHFHSFRSKNATAWAKKFSYVGKVGSHYFFNAPMYVKADYELNGDIASGLQDSGEESGEPELIQEPSYIDVDAGPTTTISI